MGRTLNKSQRRAFAKVCYLAFHSLAAVGTTIDPKEWFLESMTDQEREELAKLRSMTHKLADRWRGFAWKLDGRNAGK